MYWGQESAGKRASGEGNMERKRRSSMEAGGQKKKGSGDPSVVCNMQDPE